MACVGQGGDVGAGDQLFAAFRVDDQDRGHAFQLVRHAIAGGNLQVLAPGLADFGGLVEQGSLQRDATSLKVNFVVTDLAQKIPVTYTGLLPDLFREGKGVIAQGKLNADGVFHADQVLAKHDENYMPPEAADALAKARKGDLPAGADTTATATATAITKQTTLGKTP